MSSAVSKSINFGAEAFIFVFSGFGLTWLDKFQLYQTSIDRWSILDVKNKDLKVSERMKIVLIPKYDKILIFGSSFIFSYDFYILENEKSYYVKGFQSKSI